MHLAEKFWQTPEYLPITYIVVKFHLLSSINVWLTEIYLYNRFYIERSPKMGFWGDFGGRDEEIWWESTSVLRIAHFQTSLVQTDVPCSCILYGYSHLPQAKILASWRVPSSPTRSSRKTPLQSTIKRTASTLFLLAMDTAWYLQA